MQTRQVLNIPFDATEKAKDYALLKEVQGGSQEAFSRLVDRYKNRLFNLVVRMIPAREEAEDIVQETFLRVFQHKNNFDPKYCFSTWIYTIALNLAKNNLRRKKKVKFLELFDLEETSEEPAVEPGRVALGPWIEKEIEKLPEKYKTAFLLREMDELPYEEIAEITGVPTGTVKSRVNRARMILAESLRPKKEKLYALSKRSPNLSQIF
ncbi:MAG: sigma-70 family RNA polymerase sigma factor [candidate division Zixibacteria bacterium]|nr:sigma-70 family RNA polymerase sigma factor [candidate division Zixibacteria bacterium]